MNISLVYKSSLLKKGLLFSAFSFLNSGVNFFLILILARYFSAEQYGALNLFNTCITLITPLISLSTIGYIGVSYFQNSIRYFRDVVKSVIINSLGVFLILSLIIIIGGEYLGDRVGIDKDYLFLSIFICFLQIFTLLNLELWRLEENPLLYGLYTLGITICNFGVTLLMVIVFGGGWESRVYTLVGVATFFSLLSVGIIIKRGYLTFSVPHRYVFYQTLFFGLPLIPHQLSFWMRQGLDRFIINYFYSQAAVGIFSFAYNFANIIIILGTAFNATNSIYIYKTIQGGDIKQAKLNLLRQTKMMFCLFGVATIGIICGAYWLSPIIFPLYTSSLVYIIPLCLSAFVHCVYLLFVNYIFYFKRTKQLMLITIGFSVFQMCLSLWLTRYNMLFTAYIGLICNLLICIVVITYSNKIYPILKKNEKAEY